MKQITKVWILSGFWSVVVAARDTSPLFLILLSQLVTAVLFIADLIGEEK